MYETPMPAITPMLVKTPYGEVTHLDGVGSTRSNGWVHIFGHGGRHVRSYLDAEVLHITGGPLDFLNDLLREKP